MKLLNEKYIIRERKRETIVFIFATKKIIKIYENLTEIDLGKMM